MNKKRIALAITASIASVFIIAAPTSALTCIQAAPSKEAKCASILEPFCNANGVWEILGLILDILTMGVGVLATIGIVISGIQWLTARDNEQQVAKSKNRIFNVVIGLLTYGIMWLFLTWLLPGGITTTFKDITPEPAQSVNGCPPGQIPANEPAVADPANPANPSNPNNPNNPPAGPATETNKPIGDTESDSSQIPCDPRTTDLGVHEGWDAGRRVNFHLCSIPNLPSTSIAGYKDILEVAGRTDLSGKAVLNSRVAGAVYSMVEAAKAAGFTLSAGSTFRSFTWTAIKCGSTPGTLDGKYPDIINKAYAERDSGKAVIDRVTCTQSSAMLAPPGFSNHQSGTAIDFKTCSRRVADAGPCPDSMYGWLRANATRFGFSQYSREYWHYDTR